MKVISLFDGIGCGRQALSELNIPVESYTASEIDKFSLKISLKNHPNSLQVGNVVDFNPLRGECDLLLAGFPCQDFSLLGTQTGFNGSSGKLFFQLLRIFNKVSPKYFLFENTLMNPDIKETIDQYIGVKGIKVNSNLFSAQSRPRIYWTNIPYEPLPYELSPLTISDIFTKSFTEKYPGYYFTERKSENVKTGLIQLGGYTKCTSTLRANSFRQEHRVYSIEGKHPCLTSGNSGGFISYGTTIRRVSSVERERLQGLPDNYTEGVSKTQRRKMIGNGWSVPTVKHFFKYFQ